MIVQDHTVTPQRRSRVQTLRDLVTRVHETNFYVKVRQLAGGAKSFLLPRIHDADGGAPASARYCYSVWLRHLSHAFRHGLGAIPSVVAEVGPGNSLGIGLAALLSGARAYHAFDVINFVNPLRDIEIVERIAELFARRAPISKGGEFENVRPPLATHDFPGEILSRDHLERALQLRRSAIREAILRHAGLCTQPNDAIVLRYSTDWGSHDSTLRREAKVDLVLSQAVMQYVDDLDAAYRAHFRWLRPGGMVSHQIDFSAHETGWDWNAHWTISDLQWRIIRGGKTFFCNRQPYSAHLDSMRRAGFEVVGTVRVINHGGLPRRHLTARYQGLNDEDLSVQSALIQARKPFTALF